MVSTASLSLRNFPNVFRPEPPTAQALRSKLGDLEEELDSANEAKAELEQLGSLKEQLEVEDAGMDSHHHSPPKAYALAAAPGKEMETNEGTTV
ncbi:unnamed protein product [Effrenium voratum]|uniref:Uncharacterized protein n=1 Tax=Effrenium voratum TaxID=2562239 RepID=A0AA36N8N7_9DINO|nr:unnamed protein product [Effrenium voratum]